MASGKKVRSFVAIFIHSYLFQRLIDSLSYFFGRQPHIFRRKRHVLFNYRRNDMRFSNTFGTANVFVGFYFQKRKTKSPEVKTVPPELPLRREQPVVEN